MRALLRWLSGLIVAGVLSGLAIWAFVASRREVERERRLERPVEAPRRLVRSSSGGVAVLLDPDTQKRIGLEVKAVEVASIPREQKAYGQVLDPQPLIARYRELASAELSTEALRREHERVKSLFEKSQNVSRRALESAEAAYRAGELRVRAARRSIASEWGIAFAERDAASRELLADRLARRQAALVLVSLPGGETSPAAPTAVEISILGAEPSRLAADEVLAAPTVDATLQGAAFLLRFDEPERDLRPGASVTAYLRLPGEPRRAAVVPRSAVVRFEGRTWVYVRDDRETFARRAVTLDRSTPAGWLAPEGLSEGDPVVVVGAQLLLSEELRTEIQVEEEGEE